jgi:predicted SnoaL-like aldol condensation-catalyzing enzyme
MSIEENKAIERRVWEELLNGGKIEKLNELIAIDYLYHGPGGHEMKGIEDLKKFITWLHTSFPNVHFTLDDLIAEGDKVVTFWTMKGTHKSNKQAELKGMIISRIASGRVLESWEVFDRLAIASQLAPGWIARAMVNSIVKQMSKDRP